MSSELITSTQNAKVKFAYNLQKKARARRKEKQMVLEGTRLIQDATAQGKRPEYIFYEPGSVDYDVIAQLQAINAPLYPVTEDVIQHISDTQNPQGIAGVYHFPKPQIRAQPQRVLILDAIREPGNMGTILRTAGASGVQVVILAPECVDPYNPKVVRSGMGAHFRIPILEAPWNEIATYCEPLNVYFAIGDGTQAYTAVDWTQVWALVIGNEAHGISDAARILTGTGLTIPMTGDTESLNAAVATAVIVFEAQRQRLALNPDA
jgi:RNA methyltransferase, TrmH family